jgi:hypothetical protein
VLPTLKRETELGHRSTQSALQFPTLSHAPRHKQGLRIKPAAAEQPSLVIESQLPPKDFRISAAPSERIEHALVGKRVQPTLQRFVRLPERRGGIDLGLVDSGQLDYLGIQFLVGRHFGIKSRNNFTGTNITDHRTDLNDSLGGLIQFQIQGNQ